MPHAHVSIEGLNELARQLRGLPEQTMSAGQSTVYQIMERSRSLAMQNLQHSVKYGTGELANSLNVETQTKGNVVSGDFWSNKATAVFREYGTGPNGQKSQKDLQPGQAPPVYTQRPWFVPVDAVDIDLTAIYGMRKIKIDGKEFYFTSGQPARPFFWPAMREASRNYPDIFQENFKEGMGKL